MTKAAKRVTKAKKPAAVSEAEKYPRKAIPVNAGRTEEEIYRNFAAMLTSPELAAHRVIKGAEAKSGLQEHLDVPTLLGLLRDQAAAVNGGGLKQAEAMLINQATALQSLFASLAERGMGCTDALPFEVNMRMALRAQNQCRATLETLATIKNPPVLFAKQANVTTGPQQINNGMAAPSRAREIENEQSKLSGAGNELLPHTAASALASQVNQEVETLGKIDRAKVGRG